LSPASNLSPMWLFQTIEPAGPFFGTKYITFVGAGGKSSLIEYVAERAARAGKTVTITTTTKIYAREPYILFDDLHARHDASVKGRGRDNPRSPDRTGPVRTGKSREGEKLTALTMDEALRLGDLFDMVLIEADGAKGKPLKYPASYEPVIPPFSDRIVVVAGLDALWGTVEERVFRWELFCEVTGLSPAAVIDRDLFVRFFADPILLKGVEREKCTVFLNKWDRLRQRGEAAEMAKSIIETTACKDVVISSLFHSLFFRVAQTGA
jgi:probable selenium-dependent hydroxylase accessory protein YqeC